MERIQLPYTLQTWVGMVTNSGLPASRWTNQDDITKARLETLEKHDTVTLPRIGAVPRGEPITNDEWHISSLQDFVETDWFDTNHAAISKVVIACLRADRLPNRELIRGSDCAKNRFIANVLACRNQKMDIHRLMTFMKNRSRLNLEQAAAAVISAFVRHGRLYDTEALVRELTGILAVAHMGESREMEVSRNTLAKSRAEAFANAAEKARLWCSKAVERRSEIVAEPPRNYHDFAQLLLRVRSVHPRTKDRCLYIPPWMFEAAGIEPTGGHAVHLNEYQAELEKKGQLLDVLRGYKWPENPATDDSIILPKHVFRALQRTIFRLFHFWDPVIRLRRSIRALEDKVLYASAWIDRQLRQTDDVAKVAFWFFGYQRRLQLKVVSDDQWTRFLAKGEGSKIYQNNLKLRSTFEQVLARFAGLELGSISNSGGDEMLGLIDETCLLMKEYVAVYGQGKKENLVFKQGVRGGSGRGPVDEYNILCDILHELKPRAKEEGIEEVPGPVYKFLAKDIMSWNKSWDDDAFANGKVHGWEEWVRKRELA